MTNTPTPMTSREAFEKWYVENISGCNGEWIEKMDDGQYYEISTNKAWEAWESSQAQQEAVIVELVEALEFYANCNYATTHPDGSVELIDYGCTAEKAIAKVKGKL